jgi:uncharacterized protein
MFTLTDQYTLAKTIALSLLPGIGITLLYAILVPLITAAGLPALLIAALIGVLLFELGFLLYLAWRNTSKLSLNSVVDYRERVPVWQYALIPLLFLVWGFVVTGIAAPVDNILGATAFSWLPEWFFSNSPDYLSLFSRQV